MRSDRSIANDKFEKLLSKVLEEDREFLHKIGRMGAPKPSKQSDTSTAAQ